MTDRERMRQKLLGLGMPRRDRCKCLNNEMGFAVKGHEITDRRLVQGNMRQWDKQEECRSTKQNADSDTETEWRIQNRDVENEKSQVEENRGGNA